MLLFSKGHLLLNKFQGRINLPLAQAVNRLPVRVEVALAVEDPEASGAPENPGRVEGSHMALQARLRLEGVGADGAGEGPVVEVNTPEISMGKKQTNK